MKKFTKLWQLMMILMLSSSVALAQFNASTGTADQGNKLNKIQKKELIQKGLATEKELQQGELSKEAQGYLEKMAEAKAEKANLPEKNNMVTLKEPAAPSDGDACPGSPVWGLPATGYTSAAVSDDDAGYRVYQQFFGSYVIDSIHWWGLRYYYSGGWSACSEDPKQFEVIFYSDNAGAPGTVVSTFNATLSGVNSQLPFSADTLYEYTLVLSSPVTLTNGWISIQENPGGDPNCWFLWGNTGIAGPPSLQEDVANATFSDPGYSFSLCLYGDFENTDDLLTSDITAPNTGVGLTSTESVTMEIFNNGSNAQTDFPVSMTFDGTTYNESYVGTLNPGEYTTYTFAQTIDCSTQGQTYSVEACTDLVGDQNTANDCYTHSFENLPPFDCNWMMIGNDSYGDGWNSGYVEIVQDGTSTFTWTGPAATGPDTVYFGIWEGASMDVVWHSGSYDGEVTYDIYALWTPDTVLQFSDGPYPAGTTGIAVSCFPPACPQPDTLNTTNIAIHTAQLNWSEMGTATTWNLEWGTPGFAPGTGAALGTHTDNTGGSNPHSYTIPALPGLAAATTYEWYVQADCGAGSTSTWSGPVSFTTLYDFDTYTVPFSSMFESGFDTLDNATGNTVDWVLIDSLQVSATHSAFNVYTPNNENVLFVTGTVDLTAKVNARLSFDNIAKTEGDWDHCYVEISTDGGATYAPLPASTYLGDGIYTDPSYNNPEGPCFDEDSYTIWGTSSTDIPDNTWWKHESFNLTSYNTFTDVTFRFRLVSDGSVQRAGWLIDNVMVDEMPACPDPGALGTTFVTPTTAGLTWTEAGSATNWDIEYGATPFTPTGTPSYSTTNNPDTLTGLTPGTEYEFYVRSNCGGGTTSNWVGPYTFSTATVNTLPYAFGFEVNTLGTWMDDATTTYSWTLNSGGTPSGSTGPTAAYEGDWYVYTETSSPAVQGDTYGLISYFDFTANAAVNFNFAYSMYGATMGELELQVSSDDGATYDSVWGMAGDQGTDWHLASVDLSTYAGSTVLVRFLGTRGSSYTGDMAVDDINVFEPLAHDVATLSIDMNGFYSGGTVVTPMATVTNLGTNTETFDVQMDISGGYSDTQTVTALAPGASIQVTFANWTPANGDYTVDVCTQLGTDMDNTNDCITGQPVFVRTFDRIVYAYNTFSGGSSLPVGPISFNLNDPGTVTSLADQSAMNFVAGGTWAESFWYGTVYSDDTLIRINPADGTRETVGPLGAGINALSYDVTTGTMYGYDWDGANAGQSTLFSIDMATGAATAIGPTSGGELLINFAIDASGNAYAVDLLADNFGSVDLATGAFTVIGSIGFDANYAQDMEFDRMSGECFMAAYGSQGELRWVDVSTGMSYLVGAFDGGMEVTGMGIPYGYNVAGALTYANTGSTPLDHSTARFVAGTMERTMETDCNGVFLFDGIADGTYELNGATDKAWSSSCLSGIDIIFLKRFLAGALPLSPIKQLAADVTQSGAPSGLDVIMLKRKLAGQPAPAWTAPDYVFEPQSITVSGGDVIQGVQALCSGDVNGSYNPPFTCPAPTNLSASANGTTADLMWTSNSGNSNLEWGPAGFTPGTGTLVVGVTSPYTVTGLTLGNSYDFYVQDICCGGAGLSDWAGPATFTSQMCDAGATTCDEYIDGVVIGTINNTGSGCGLNGNGYSDYTAMSTDLTQGTVGVSITITNGYSYASDDLGIWIDWDQDGVFDPATENVVCDVDGGADGTFTFDVPATATLGQTIMRVRIKYSGSDCGSPCGITSYGEVEDYTVNIVP